LQYGFCALQDIERDPERDRIDRGRGDDVEVLRRS
jgi:hypothetical protein